MIDMNSVAIGVGPDGVGSDHFVVHPNSIMRRRNRNILHELRELFSGKRSTVGRRIFDKWFHSFDDSKGLLDELDEQEQVKYSHHLFDELKSDLNLVSSPEPVRYYRKLKHRYKNAALYRTAAILMTGFLLSFFLAESLVTVKPEVETIQFVEKSNPRGQISNVVLPDGSSVWLGPESSLEYPEEFSDLKRTVSLTGEAYFDVVPDASRPFAVDRKSTRLNSSHVAISYSVFYLITKNNRHHQ